MAIGTVKIIIESVGILVGLILIWIHWEEIKKKKIIQKLRDFFETSPTSIGKFFKYTLCFLVVGSFMYIFIIQAHKVEFTPQIYKILGFCSTCFVAIAMMLAKEGNREIGNKELIKEEQKSISDFCQ